MRLKKCSEMEPRNISRLHIYLMIISETSTKNQNFLGFAGLRLYFNSLNTLPGDSKRALHPRFSISIQLLSFCGWPLPLGSWRLLYEGFPRLPTEHLTSEDKFLLGLQNKLLGLTISNSFLEIRDALVLK